MLTCRVQDPISTRRITVRAVDLVSVEGEWQCRGIHGTIVVVLCNVVLVRALVVKLLDNATCTSAESVLRCRVCWSTRGDGLNVHRCVVAGTDDLIQRPVVRSKHGSHHAVSSHARRVARRVNVAGVCPSRCYGWRCGRERARGCWRWWWWPC
jgi:hypothetical protein